MKARTPGRKRQPTMAWRRHLHRVLDVMALRKPTKRRKPTPGVAALRAMRTPLRAVWPSAFAGPIPPEKRWRP